MTPFEHEPLLSSPVARLDPRGPAQGGLGSASSHLQKGMTPPPASAGYRRGRAIRIAPLQLLGKAERAPRSLVGGSAALLRGDKGGGGWVVLGNLYLSSLTSCLMSDWKEPPIRTGGCP